jgi:hypothetical protein
MLSFVVLLLPLTLGQSSTGGCGVTVTMPDSDSNTSTGSCSGLSVRAFYNDEYGYGFELPLLSYLEGYDDLPTFLFNADWRVAVGSTEFGLHTQVHQLPDVGLTDDTAVLDAFTAQLYASDDDHDFVSQDRYTLADGRMAYLTVFSFTEFPTVVTYEFLTVRTNLLFRVSAAIRVSEVNPVTDAVIMDTLSTVCLD